MYISSSNLPDILKQIRFERGLSLRELSVQIGISHAYLNKLERGEDLRTGKPITPTIETLVKISEGLNIPVKKFLNMCGYFEVKFPAKEPYQGDGINLDTEISAIIAQITSSTTVTVGETQVNEEVKVALREELRQILIKIRKNYDTDEG